MKFKEVRCLTGYALQELCIKNNWFTSGTCKEYGRLLAMPETYEHITTEKIAEIAAYTIEHSSNLTDSDEDMESVMFEIARASATFFYKIA